MRRSLTLAAVAVWITIGGIVPGTAIHALFATGEQTVRLPGRFKAGDTELRDWAIKSPSPTYPPASIAQRVAGVVVATIRIDPRGATEAVGILQSADAATGRAVQDALMHWTFKPPPFGHGGDGILVFYCRDPLEICAGAVHGLRSTGFNGQVSVLSR